jgi:hypothetical protein
MAPIPRFPYLDISQFVDTLETYFRCLKFHSRKAFPYATKNAAQPGVCSAVEDALAATFKVQQATVAHLAQVLRRHVAFNATGIGEFTDGVLAVQ